MIVFFQRRLSPIIAGLIALTLVISLVAAIDRHRGGELYYRLALAPAEVWHGELWRLVTWPFVVTHPLVLLFECVALFRFGPELVIRWGPAKFWRFVVGVMVFAGLGTCLAALVHPASWSTVHFGGMLLGNVLVIAWGLQFPDGRVRLYEVLVLRGPVLVFIVVGVYALFALFYGVARELPALLACAAALLAIDQPHHRWLQKLRALRARRKLGVIRGDRHGGPYYPN